ncbi:MAG: hypothetical protein NW206_02830 [Hyphomonadaceae bacterium]|nr:hypothetical protein [Hyphomonadaceae bacterium]
MSDKLRSVLVGVGVLAVGVLGGVVGSASTRYFGTSSYTMSYADFVSVMLTAVSLLITLLGLVLAVAAFIGWSAISERVRNRTDEYLLKGFSDGEALSKLLQDKLLAYVTKEMEPGDPLYEAMEKAAERVAYQGVLEIEPDDPDGEKDDGNPR